MDKDVAIMNDEVRKIRRQRTSNRRNAGEKSPFMSISQVLELVPVGKSTLYLMIADGKFPKQKKPFGSRAAMWSKEEVNQWVQNALRG